MGEVSLISQSLTLPFPKLKTQIGSLLFFFLFFNVLNLQNFAPNLMGFCFFPFFLFRKREKRMVEITRLHRHQRRCLQRRKTTFRSPPFTRSTAFANGAPRKSKMPFVISMVKFTYKPPTNFILFSNLYIVVICLI